MPRLLSIAVLLATAAFASGCATPEYLQAHQLCSQEWFAKIPPIYQQVLVNRSRRIQVPDGTSTCTTSGNTTKCKQGMRSDWVPYVEAQTVDINQDQRDLRIDQCAANRCIRSYGNSDCKT